MGRKTEAVRAQMCDAPEVNTPAVVLLPDRRRVPVYVSGLRAEPGAPGLVIEFRSYSPVVLPPAAAEELLPVDWDGLARSVAEEEAGVPRRTSQEVHDELRRRAAAQEAPRPRQKERRP